MSAFSRYVDRAREGRTGIGYLIAGIVIIVLAWAATTTAALVIGTFASGLVARFGPGGAGDGRQLPWTLMQDFLASPAGIVAVLASFIGMSFGVFLAVRLVQGRRFGGVLGASGRLAWAHFGKGLAASLLTAALAEIATYFVDPSLRRTGLPVLAWLGWCVPLTLLLFVQISAEELMFRGYLPQTLAARFRSPLVWAGLPVVLFTLLHWNGETGAAMQGATLLSIGAFALLAIVLVVKTGNLGAGMGAHLGLNMFGILFVSHMSWLSGAALFASRPLDAGRWSTLDALLIGLFGIASFGLTLLLLIHPRSPLSVVEA
jgi:membrane protease YdiL (CAAX protease family)